jgi:hypothetical protein
VAKGLAIEGGGTVAVLVEQQEAGDSAVLAEEVGDRSPTSRVSPHRATACRLPPRGSRGDAQRARTADPSRGESHHGPRSQKNLSSGLLSLSQQI